MKKNKFLISLLIILLILIIALASIIVFNNPSEQEIINEIKSENSDNIQKNQQSNTDSTIESSNIFD